MTESSENLIAKISMAFVRRFRVTILIFLAIIAAGYVSYTTLLPREGIPDIAYPLVFVQAQYQSGDAFLQNELVTKPIEVSLKNIDGITQVDTNTGPVFSSAIVYFDTEYSSDEAAKMINDEFASSLKVPEQTILQVLPFKANVDGEHDFLLAIASDDMSSIELQDKAGEIADKLATVDSVKDAEAIDLINTQFNPMTGQMETGQTTFSRIGEKKDGELKFSNSILVGLVKKDKTNDIKLSKDVRKEVDQLKASGALEGIDVVYTADNAVFVDQQISSLQENAISAILIVILVLLLFINWRSAVITALFIPAGLAATFIGLLVVGYSLNVMVLFGLILVLGLFVDDAIVVVETIDYHKRHGAKGLEAIKAGVTAIGMADVLGTVTTIIAFIPMVTISGILGEFIRPIPITVIIALIVSLLIALTVIPFFGYILIPNKKESKPRGVYALVDLVLNGFNRGILRVGERVSQFVRFYTSKWYWTLAVVVFSFVMIGVGIFFAGKLKFSVFPPQKDSDGIYVTITYPNGSDLGTKEAIADQVDEILSNDYSDVIDSVNYTFVGVNQFGIDQAMLDIPLIPMGERDRTSIEISDEITEKLALVQGARISADEYQAGPPAEEYSYKMQVYGDDQKVLESSSASIAQYIKSEVKLDGIEILDTRVDYLDAITKRDGKRYVEVAAKIDDPTNSGALIDIENQVKEHFVDGELEQLGLEAASLDFDKGMESDNVDAFNSAGIALLAAMVMIYLLLVVQFNSFLQPLLIFMAFPFSFPGLFTGLYLTDNALSFFVMVGVIALVGIVVNNTIMLLDFTQQYSKHGKGIQDSIVEAIRVRFRPLVTTSVVAVIGLFPLALNDPLWESIAFSIIFGLMSSTFMVIFVFPAYYMIVENLRAGAKGLGKRLLPGAEA
ncbi:efflux RND transporter permease subunit [Candidatus Dojkabacteria bacterium]|nr:efflux RND transporter permease subunit [Candidatus Dojkabacteria bacterium]